MKKQKIESDYIGGQGSLSREEENALSRYFADKKMKKLRQVQTSNKKIAIITT